MMKSNVISVRALDETSGDRNLEEVKPRASSDEGHESISEDQNGEENFSYLNGLYPLVIIIFCVVYNTTHTLIPYHDVFEFPSFWWENIIQFCFFFVAQRMVISSCWEVWLVFKRKETLSFQWFIKMVGTTFIGTTYIYISLCTFYGHNTWDTIGPCPFGF